MTSATFNACLVQLKADEGFRARVYDDATGAPLHATGTPTIGYGCACVAWSDALATVVLTYQFTQCLTAVLAALPWAESLGEPRVGVLAQLAFNLGVAGLLAFHQMLAHLEAGEWAAASLQLKASTADHQEPQRIARWAETLVTGVAWQPGVVSASSATSPATARPQ